MGLLCFQLIIVFMCTCRLYLLPAPTFLSASCYQQTQTSLPHFLLPALPPTFLSLCPLRHLPAIYRRPSISLACQCAFSFGLLLQGARRWQITTRQPVIFNLSESPPSLPPSFSAGHTHYPCQHQFRHIAISHHPHLFSPSFHIFLLISAENLAHKPQDRKKRKEILWQWKHSSKRGSQCCIITQASVSGDDPREWKILIACHSRHSADCIDKACRGL